MAVIANHCPEIKVTLVDIDFKKIDAWNDLNLDNLPIYEPGLKELVFKLRNKNLFFSSNIELEISQADMIFISVNTPTKLTGEGAGYASDLKWVESSARQVAKFSKGHTIVVEKSTVPVRTAELIERILRSSTTSSNESFKSFSVLSSPEFLAEGTAIRDLEAPDRVLIGGQDFESIKILSGIYERWIKREKILFTNVWSSELSKLTANAFLAQRISSINAISALCEATGAEINEVSLAIGTDSRIGNKFLSAGPGFGGSCFQKDILNLVYLCKYYGLNEVANYWEQVLLLNIWQKKRISSILINRFFGTVTSKKICLLGFSFKPFTNDTRESSSISIAKDLIENGAHVVINDPQVSRKQISIELGYQEEKIQDQSEGIWTFSSNVMEAVKGSDAIVLVTGWNEYLNLDWQNISNLMRKPAWIFDTVNHIDQEEIKGTGLNLWQLGFGIRNFDN